MTVFPGSTFSLVVVVVGVGVVFGGGGTLDVTLGVTRPAREDMEEDKGVGIFGASLGVGTLLEVRAGDWRAFIPISGEESSQRHINRRKERDKWELPAAVFPLGVFPITKAKGSSSGLMVLADFCPRPGPISVDGTALSCPFIF